MSDRPLIELGQGRTVRDSEVVRALADAGIGPGDVVMVHSRLFSLGRPMPGLSKKEYCHRWISLLLDVIGDSGTLVIPTASLTFRQGEIFDLENTPTHPALGMLAEAVRRRPDARRSVQPFISVAAIGKQSGWLVDVGRSTFGKESVYDRLHTLGGAKFLTLGLGIPEALTYLHYVEQCAGVVYRYVKEFDTRIRVGGREYRAVVDYFATVFHPSDVDADFHKFEAVALDRRLARRVTVGHGFIQTIEERPCFELAMAMLEDDPTCLLRIAPHSPYGEYIHCLTMAKRAVTSRT